MSLSAAQQAKYNQVVDLFNQVLIEMQAMFLGQDMKQNPEYLDALNKAANELETGFLFFQKGVNILHQKSPAFQAEVVEQAVASAEANGGLRVLETPPAAEPAPVGA